MAGPADVVSSRIPTRSSRCKGQQGRARLVNQAQTLKAELITKETIKNLAL